MLTLTISQSWLVSTSQSELSTSTVRGAYSSASFASASPRIAL